MRSWTRQRAIAANCHLGQLGHVLLLDLAVGHQHTLLRFLGDMGGDFVYAGGELRVALDS
jgi:hypothetical protein